MGLDDPVVVLALLPAQARSARRPWGAAPVGRRARRFEDATVPPRGALGEGLLAESRALGAGRFREKERFGEVIPLRVADPRRRLQIGELLERLDPFGHDCHAERMAERLDRPQDALAARALVNGRDE